jgi:hypothetical protein
MATLTYPADPTAVGGAAVIQASVFALVAADYTRIDHQQASQALRNSGHSAPYFPKNDTGNWIFARRVDAYGPEIPQILGMRVTPRVITRNVFSPTLAAITNVALRTFEVAIFNWHPAVVSMTDGTALPVLLTSQATATAVVNPESGDVFGTEVEYRHLLEAVGVMFKQVAANPPDETPFMKLVASLYPIS